MTFVADLNEPKRPVLRYKRRPKRLLDLVCAALLANKGLVVPTAKAIGMDPSNLRRYIQAHPKAAEAEADGRGLLAPYAESKLLEAVDAGAPWAVTLLITSLGKKLGYGLEKGSTLNVGDTNNVTITTVNIQSVPSGRFVEKPDVTKLIDRPPITIEHEPKTP